MNLFLFISTSILSIATPSPAHWTRIVFLGANDSSYICLIHHWYQPGSYYEQYDSLSICRFSNQTNLIQDNIYTRITTRIDTSTNGNWNIDDKYFPFDINQYMILNNTSYLFPSDRFDNFKLSFYNYNLYLCNSNKKYLILDSNRIISPQINILVNTVRMNASFLYKHVLALTSEAEVLEYYESGSYYFFLIKTGQYNGDSDCLQFVHPVPKNVISSAIEEITKRSK